MLAEGNTLYIQTEANYPLAGAHGSELKVGVSTKKVWPSPSEETMVSSLVPPVNCPQPHTKTDPHTCPLGPALAGGQGVLSKKAQLTAIPHPGHIDSVPLS